MKSWVTIWLFLLTISVVIMSFEVQFHGKQIGDVHDEYMKLHRQLSSLAHTGAPEEEQ